VDTAGECRRTPGSAPGSRTSRTAGRAAAAADLSVTWDAKGLPTVSLWAPTARSVNLELFTAASGGIRRTVPMRRDDRTGVWSVKGGAAWEGRHYTFDVRVFSPYADDGHGAFVANRVTDPYSVALSTDSARSRLVDLDDPGLAPEGWGDLAKPEAVGFEDEPVHALPFKGTRYDCGNKLGFLKANVELALKHPELAESFGSYLRELNK
jgi:hypothetical protein